MSFDIQQGYVPRTFDQLMNTIRQGVNQQFGTNYTQQNFEGTNFYKFYFTLIQRLQENEVKTAEIYQRLQDYFNFINERIARPASTPPGIIEAFQKIGVIASLKAPDPTEAGEARICLDVDETADDYAEKKLEYCNLIKNSVVAGVVTVGGESETITLSNGQSFDFAYNLPNRVQTWLRLTVTLSENNQLEIGSVDSQKFRLLENLAARYRLGLNFEPQKYYSLADAPWASQVTLEYSFDDDTYLSAVYVTDFDELLTFNLADIIVVEN